MVKRKLTVGGLISHLASVEHYHSFVKSVIPTCNFFMEYYPRFSVAPSKTTQSSKPRFTVGVPSLS